MHTTTLRKVGGSVMLSVPPALLDVMHLKAGGEVTLDFENGQLVVFPKTTPRYTLAELLAESDYSQTPSTEELEWREAPAVGRELL